MLTNAPIDPPGPLGEAGARLRALVAKWRADGKSVAVTHSDAGGNAMYAVYDQCADELDVELDNLFSGFCGKCEDGWVCENHPDKGWPSGCDCGAGMLCACRSAPVVSPPHEHSTRFVWLMERHLSRDSGLLGAIAAGTLVYWDGGHAESFTTDANRAVQWPSEAAAKAQCPPEHYEQWGWRYVEHGFTAAPVVSAPPHEPVRTACDDCLAERRKLQVELAALRAEVAIRESPPKPFIVGER